MAEKNETAGTPEVPGQPGSPPPKMPETPMEPKARPFYVKWYFRITLFLGSMVLLGLIGSVGMVGYSNTPEFCNSCHIMEPYYNAWKTSGHNQVPCIKCHIRPGLQGTLEAKFQAMSQVVRYVTRTYGSKPTAEVDDKNCLAFGCHDTRLLKGKVKFKKGVVFDHAPHLTQIRRGKKLQCTSCHSQIVQGTHMEVTEDTCFICHFKGIDLGRNGDGVKLCTTCHEVPDYDIDVGGMSYNHSDFVTKGVDCLSCHKDVIQGDGAVAKTMCLSCHADPERFSALEDHEFLHFKHVTERKVECFQCHSEITHKVRRERAIEPPSCQNCHTKKHNLQQQMLYGVGARGIEKPMPSVMAMAHVDCTGCHVNPEGKYAIDDVIGNDQRGYTYKASSAACIRCHDEDYGETLNEWRTEIQADLLLTKAEIHQVDEVLATLKGNDPKLDRIRPLAEDAWFNYDFVLHGRGVHNTEYAAAALEKAREYCQQALDIAQK